MYISRRLHTKLVMIVKEEHWWKAHLSVTLVVLTFLDTDSMRLFE